MKRILILCAALALAGAATAQDEADSKLSAGTWSTSSTPALKASEFMFNNADQVWFMDSGLRRDCATNKNGKEVGNVKTRTDASGGRLLHIVAEPLIQVKSRTYSGDAPLFIADGETLPWHEILGRAE